MAVSFTALHPKLGILLVDMKFAHSSSAMATHSMKLPPHDFMLRLMAVEVYNTSGEHWRLLASALCDLTP